ncbi:MAG: GIY-YIG nuclease family protein [Polaromonas sp.]
MAKTYHIYLLASRSRNLYVGVTSDLMQRIWQHRSHVVPGHTARYRITRLVHFEETEDVLAAIAREKQIKGWRREKKIALIKSGNPAWDDLASSWFEE